MLCVRSYAFCTFGKENEQQYSVCVLFFFSEATNDGAIPILDIDTTLLKQQFQTILSLTHTLSHLSEYLSVGLFGRFVRLFPFVLALLHIQLQFQLDESRWNLRQPHNTSLRSYVAWSTRSFEFLSLSALKFSIFRLFDYVQFLVLLIQFDGNISLIFAWFIVIWL